MFPISGGTRGFGLPYCWCFCLPCYLWASWERSLNSLHLVAVWLSPTVIMLESYWGGGNMYGEEVFYNFM